MQYLSIILIGIVIVFGGVLFFISQRQRKNILLSSQDEQFNNYDMSDISQEKRQYLLEYNNHNTIIKIIVIIGLLIIGLAPFFITIVDTLQLSKVITTERYNIRMRDSFLLLGFMALITFGAIKICINFINSLSRQYRDIIKNMPSEDFEHMKIMSETAFFIEKYNQPYLKSGHILYFISYLKSFAIDITTIQDITIDYGYKGVNFVNIIMKEGKEYKFGISSHFTEYLRGIK